MKITKSNISNLLGKTIRWSAPAAEGNFPYGGLARITEVNANETNPLKTEELAGCTLDLAFFPDGSDTLCYSDAGREVDASVFDGMFGDEDSIKEQGEYMMGFDEEVPIIIVKSENFSIGGDEFTMHWFVGGFASSVAIELGGEFFVTDDWQGYVPTEPEGIGNCRWLHDGHPCIILNGLPRIFPA